MTEQRRPSPDAAGDELDDDVDESSEESFPASDPPSSWSGEPGHDPVVRPGGDGAWVPGGAPPGDDGPGSEQSPGSDRRDGGS